MLYALKPSVWHSDVFFIFIFYDGIHYCFFMQGFVKLAQPKKIVSPEEEDKKGSSPQKTEASPTKKTSPQKREMGAYDSLILRRVPEKQFTFNINSFDKGRQRQDVLEEPDQGEKESNQSEQERQIRRNIIYSKEAYQEKQKEAELITTAQYNNSLFSQIFLNKQLDPVPKKEEPIHNQPNNIKENQIIEDEQIIGGFEQIANSSETSAPESTLKISDFQLGKRLGVGKFGQVFLARHRATGFVCALKRIERARVDSRLGVQLAREIKIQSFLNHPNIVKLYGWFAEEEHVYLIMELCYSGQLYSYLKKWRRVPQDATRSIVLQVCRALDHMHANEVIHRDLKPQNIIYQSGLVKICDLGWSIGSSTLRATFCGTPLYVSPELLKRSHYNNKIDVWSVGILTYELLFGKVPFEIQTEQDFVKIVEDEIKFSRITKVSDEAKDFILNCLAKDPADRYTVPELIEHAFLARQQIPPILDMY